MDVLKTIAVDIRHSVFDNETEAILYVTRDFYSDNYIVAIPVICFSWAIWDGREQNDLNDLLHINIEGIRKPERKEKLVEAIKAAIDELK